MADFLAITFDEADGAEAALRSIRALEKAGRIRLEDTAVVRKDAEGKVTIHNEMASGTRPAPPSERSLVACSSSSSRWPRSSVAPSPAVSSDERQRPASTARS